MNPLKLILLSLPFISIGTYLLIMLGLTWYHQQNMVAAATPITIPSNSLTVAQRKTTVSGIPRHISIPAVDIDTDVADGTYDVRTASWSITEEAAFYATSTTPSNSADGNTFIYGHNSKEIFGNLRSIKPGAIATVRGENGTTFTYKYTSSEEVSPDDARVLAYEGKPRLMLQTCTGAWNQLRLIVYLELIDYAKA